VHVEGILFDYGGTLDGAASHWLDRVVGLYRAEGIDRPFAAIKDAFYRTDDVAYADPRVAEMSLAELLDYHFGVQCSALGIDDLALRRRLAAAFVAQSDKALAASHAVLARLAPHYRLGVVSNFYGNVGRILSDAGFGPLLTVVADSNRVGSMKPDRRIFEHALRGLGTAPAVTLHVGDSYARDVQAAHALGLRTAWLVAPAGRPPGRDPVADLVIESLDELAAFLRVPAGAPAAARR
jgi:FMN phosphatase YigB (HAD superfamily)